MSFIPGPRSGSLPLSGADISSSGKQSSLDTQSENQGELFILTSADVALDLGLHAE